jgi:DNA replication protein DnaC
MNQQSKQPEPLAEWLQHFDTAYVPPRVDVVGDEERAHDAERRADLRRRFEASVPASYRWARLGDPAMLVRAPLPEGVSPMASVHAERLVIAGSPGTGKTSLAVAMLRERFASTGRLALFVHCHRLGTARIQHKAGDGEAGSVEEAMKAPLILLDDLGAEHGGVNSALLDVVRERHAEGLPTWVTTGLTREEIAERYDGGIVRRILDRAHVIRMGGAK